MSHLTHLGVTVDTPWVLSKSLPDTAATRELRHKLQMQFDVLLRLDREIGNLREDNSRLTHENTFMLKLINKHMEHV